MTPFRRVSDTVAVDPRLTDNSFEAKVSSLFIFLINPLFYLLDGGSRVVGCEG